MTERTDTLYLAIRSLMAPRHANACGMILDDVVLSKIDEAGAVGARHETRLAGWPDQPMVTVGIKSDGQAAIRRLELRAGR